MAVYRAEYVLLITDRFLVPLGDPLVDWVTLDVTLRFNEPGSGLFTVPGYSWIRDQLIPGARVMVMRYRMDNPAGEIIMSGPIENWQYERSDDGDNAGVGNLTVTFGDDLAPIVARQTYADPTLAPEAQVADYWTWTGNAEVGLRTLVDLNAGPSARPERQVYGLVLGTLAGVGSGTITTKTDLMEPLGDVARRMAVSGGGLGFRAVQVGTQIQFQVYQPADKSLSCRFSFSLGNVKYVSYELAAPTANAAIVGGQGEGADRYTTEVSDSDSQTLWGRWETLVSRPGSAAPADLTADGNQALADGAATARLTTNVSDTDGARYGIDYNLGDTVAVETYPGESLVDVVRTVHIQAWPTAGDVISATVGSQEASRDPKWLQLVREMADRVGKLERTVRPAAIP